ncbi:hypothetical protein GWI33_005422 [Rhynchophorus ferrugineus]|uniref:Uncharacterized protein n=1 Tax=Rhynchophorus ferrugineus TaxID=354439 RepID=A0A834MEI8_RHYFE|nr:hypothetical protein GWI33_005422 [Rhynchophorus ferrugineus]
MGPSHKNNKLWEVKRIFYQSINHNNISRRKSSVLARLRLGHCKLTHEYLLKGQSPPLCDLCQIQLSVRHILLDCQKYDDLRRQLEMPTTLEQLVQPEQLNLLIDYLKTIDLLQHL